MGIDIGVDIGVSGCTVPPMPRASRTNRTVVEPSEPPPGDDFPEGDGSEVLEADPGDLAALADASYSEWKWQIYRVRSPEEMAASRARQQTVWVLTLTGPLDVSQLRETVGGGVFRVWGYLGGGLRLKRTFELEGPPRIYAPPPPPVPTPAAAAAATSTAPNGTDPVLMTLLQNQQKTLDAIVARLAVPAAAPGLSFRDALAMAELMGRGGGGVEMKDLVGLFQQGIEIGGSAVGGNEKSTLEVILEKGLPALERVAASMASRTRVRPPAPPPAPKREPSSATVVEDPTPPTYPPVPPSADLSPEQQQAAVRWGGAVDALARAIADGADPADFAGTLDHLLLADEIELMLAGGAVAVLEQIRTAGDRYPILLTPDAERFVSAVLVELQEPAEPTP